MLHLLLIASSFAIPAPIHRNLIVNGNFSGGNKGFKTGYTLGTDLGPEGNYVIGTNPHDYHMGGASFGSHTTGKGPMLLFNGSRVENTTVWEQTVSVTPNHKYSFGLWAASWGQLGQPGVDPSPAKLVITINGKRVGQPFAVYARDGAWTKFSASWAAGSSKSADIRIVDTNLEGVGNDFAIDDLVFHE
jgi:hypothetical protein